MDKKNIDTDFLSKEEINDIFADIFEFSEDESIQLAYSCAATCDAAPQTK